MKKIIFLMGVFLVFARWAEAVEPLPEAKNAYAAAMMAYIENGDVGACRDLLLEAISLSPAYAAPRYNLGLLAEKQERWTEAHRWYEEFIEGAPESPDAVKARVKLDRLKQLETIDSTPEGKRARQFQAHVKSATDYLNTGQLGSSLADAEMAIELEPDKFEGHFLAGMAFAQVGGFSEATMYLEKAKQLAPAVMAVEIEKTLAAVAEEEQLEADLVLAQEALTAGKYGHAATVFEKVWTRDIEREQVGLSAAMAWLADGEQARGEEILLRLLSAKDSRISSQARGHLNRAGKLSSSAASLGSSTVEQPEDLPGGAMYTRGLFLLEAGKPYLAEAEFSKALSGVEPPAEYASFFVARAKSRQGTNDHPGAVQDLTQALILKPGLIEAYRLRGQSYAATGDLHNARMDYYRAIELTPEEKLKSHLQDELDKIK